MIIWAVGDIHGCYDELQDLNKIMLPQLKEEDHLVFLGDYIDRGPDSKRVIDILIHVSRDWHENTVFLRGNHEDMMLNYLGYPGKYGRDWCHNGSDQTLGSYGVSGSDKTQIFDKLGNEHLNFLLGLEYYHELGDYLFVHAGINPSFPLEEQMDEDLIWIREGFIGREHTLGKVVVHGHTYSTDVSFDLPYSINVDTACVYGGKLSALRIDTEAENKYRIIDIIAKNVYY